MKKNIVLVSTVGIISLGILSLAMVLEVLNNHQEHQKNQLSERILQENTYQSSTSNYYSDRNDRVILLSFGIYKVGDKIQEGYYEVDFESTNFEKAVLTIISNGKTIKQLDFDNESDYHIELANGQILKLEGGSGQFIFELDNNRD